MNMKFYSAFSLLFLLGCSSVEERTPTQVVIPASPPPPMYQDNSSAAMVLKKRSLSHNREQYQVRLANGREVYFIVDSPLPYQVGDVIILPS